MVIVKMITVEVIRHVLVQPSPIDSLAHQTLKKPFDLIYN